MAEGDGVIYNEWKEQIMKGVCNMVTDEIKVALVTAYTPDIDAHDSWPPATAVEAINTTGYTTGGEILGSKAVTEDTTNDRGKFDAADVTWTGLQITAAPTHAIMWDNTMTSPADMLIAYWVVTTPTNGGNYTLAWHADGIIYIQ